MDSQTILRATKPIVHNPHWIALEDLLKDYIKSETSALLGSKDIGDIREIQGKIKSYQRILALPQIVKDI